MSGDFAPSKQVSDELAATIYDQGLASDKITIRRSKEQQGSYQVVCLLGPLERPAIHPVVRRVLDQSQTRFGECEAGSNGINTDAVITRLSGQCPGKADDTALRSDVVGPEW